MSNKTKRALGVILAVLTAVILFLEGTMCGLFWMVIFAVVGVGLAVFSIARRANRLALCEFIVAAAFWMLAMEGNAFDSYQCAVAGIALLGAVAAVFVACRPKALNRADTSAPQ